MFDPMEQQVTLPVSVDRQHEENAGSVGRGWWGEGTPVGKRRDFVV
jgi:hypothetical protein